jgi:hypothetical protein
VRHAVFLLFAAAQLAFNLNRAPFFNPEANSARFPKATQRCHSVLDSQIQSEFLPEVFVATENVVSKGLLFVVLVCG